jgi:hypothetical protein
MNPVNTQLRALETRIASLEVKLGRLQNLVHQIAAANDQFRLKPRTARELHADVVRPKWLRVNAAIVYTGFGRAFLYSLIYANQPGSIVIKTDKKNTRGIGLNSRAALDEFIRTKRGTE